MPAAVGAYAGVAVWTVVLQHLNGDFEFVGQLASAIFAPIAFVYAGTKTAPTHYLTAAISLTVLHAIILAGMFGFIAYGWLILKVNFKDPVWWAAVRAVIGVVVTVAVCAAIARDDPDSQETPADAA